MPSFTEKERYLSSRKLTLRKQKLHMPDIKHEYYNPAFIVSLDMLLKCAFLSCSLVI
jgi:hypothetical protein